MKRLIIFFLAFSIFSVQADVGSRHSIKELVNDLNYSLTVEWDQKDARYYEQKMNEFHSELERLHQEGHDHTVLINELISSLPDQHLAKDLKQALTVMKLTKMSPEESGKLLNGIASNHQLNGAEWAGAVAIVAVGLIGVLVGGVVLLAYISGKQQEAGNCRHECVWENNNCKLVYVCD